MHWKKKEKRSDKDKAWIDKQVLALTRQGFTTQEIKSKYSIGERYIARLRKQAGMNLRGETKKQTDVKAFNGFTYPDIGSFITIRPKHYGYKITCF